MEEKEGEKWEEGEKEKKRSSYLLLYYPHHSCAIRPRDQEGGEGGEKGKRKKKKEEEGGRAGLLHLYHSRMATASTLWHPCSKRRKEGRGKEKKKNCRRYLSDPSRSARRHPHPHRDLREKKERKEKKKKKKRREEKEGSLFPLFPRDRVTTDRDR